MIHDHLKIWSTDLSKKDILENLQNFGIFLIFKLNMIYLIAIIFKSICKLVWFFQTLHTKFVFSQLVGAWATFVNVGKKKFAKIQLLNFSNL